jgi:uncharacterized protein DUF4252
VRRRTAILLGFSMAALLPAQQFKFDLQHLASKSSNVVDISLNGSTLQFAARFLDGKDPDEVKVKKLLAGIEGIYIKSFEFKQDGAWSQSDLDQVRNQLRAPEWERMIGVQSKEDNENAEVFVRYENKKITGIAILVTETRQFTVVNIVGPVDLESLADLSGHFGVPKLEAAPKKK